MAGSSLPVPDARRLSGGSEDGMGSGYRRLKGKKKKGAKKTKSSGGKGGGKTVTSGANCQRRLNANGRKLDKNVVSLSGCSRKLGTTDGE